MSGNKPRPVIGKLVGGWGSGERFGFADAPATSPRSPLDLKIQSPRGLKNIYDLGGVGLGIVAALEKASDSGPDTRASKPVFVRNLSRNSKPIPVKLPPTDSDRGGCRRGLEEMELDDDLEEDYTFVTFHGPNKDYDTRVYSDNGVEMGRSGGHDRIVIDKRSKNCGHVAAFDISPAGFGDDTRACPGSDFLSSCHLCQKKLHGRDIYMYRGEKAFCSTECRYRQMVTDERKEQCCSSRSFKISCSRCFKLALRQSPDFHHRDSCNLGCYYSAIVIITVANNTCMHFTSSVKVGSYNDFPSQFWLKFGM